MTAKKKYDLSLYFIADPETCAPGELPDIVRAALKGGATMIQLRDKRNDKNQTLELAKQISAIISTLPRGEGVRCLYMINDNVHLAKKINADGVHLGQDDMKPEEAQKILGPDKIIGLTAFTPEHIKSINPKIIDYIGTGPVYSTKTDKGKPVLGPEKFAELVKLSPVPVVGIGGITAENTASVIQSGADGVAVMRGISVSPDPESTARTILEIIKKERLK